MKNIVTLTTLALLLIAGCASKGNKQAYTVQLVTPLQIKFSSVSPDEIGDIRIRDKSYSQIAMTKDRNPTIMVQNYREYTKAFENGYRIIHTPNSDTTLAYIKARDRLLDYLERAKPPEKSFIINVEATNLDLLTVRLFAPYLYPLDEDRHGVVSRWIIGEGLVPLDEKDLSSTFRHKILAKEFRLEEVSRYRLDIVNGSKRFRLVEKARADFNGDGIEDILVYASYHVEGMPSSWRKYTYTLLTRTSPDSKFERIHEQPDKELILWSGK